MRRIIVSNLMSLDGFFEGPQRKLDWFVIEQELLGYSRELLRSIDTILFGRSTYEHMAAYWPSAPADEIADMMNRVPKIVFSKSLRKADWSPSRLVAGDAVKEIAKLKRRPGGDMVILGSGALASSLLQAGLIDEYRVILNPVVLGSGKPLFKNIRGRIRLKLAGVRRLGSGVVVLSYQNQI